MFLATAFAVAGFFTSTAEAGPQWRIAWTQSVQIPGATDVAVCNDGIVYATVPAGAKTNLVRTTASLATTSSVSIVTDEAANGVVHISCGTNASGMRRLVALDSRRHILVQQQTSSSAVTFRNLPWVDVATAPAADDVKGLGRSEVLAHNTDRRDYRGVPTGGGTLAFSYLGDMWGASEVAAGGGGSSEFAVAINDDDTFWVNLPLGNLNMNVGWLQASSGYNYHAVNAIDIEVTRVGTSGQIGVVALMPSGEVWYGVICNDNAYLECPIERA